MADEPQSPVKDPHYDLISILEASLQMVWKVETYAQDAEQAGDTELAQWFRAIQENNRTAGEQGKQMLAQRLQNQGG
jgi:predicted metal-dependent HD superfamily phosphohydrolase